MNNILHQYIISDCDFKEIIKQLNVILLIQRISNLGWHISILVIWLFQHDKHLVDIFVDVTDFCNNSSGLDLHYVVVIGTNN